MVGMMKTIKRLLSLAVCLALLLALLPQALADEPLRAYCYNFHVTTKDGIPTGFGFYLGAQNGTAPYKLSYVMSGGANLSGTIASGNYATVPGSFASGTYTIDVTATDALGAISTARMVATYTLNPDNSFSSNVVQAVAPQAVKTTKITLDKSAVMLQAGGASYETLKATVEPATASNKGVLFASSNPSVATVSADGVIAGVAAGNCTVTATAADGSGASASCMVTVIQRVESIQVQPASLALGVGDTAVLTPQVLPTDTSNQSVTFTSANPAVAVVANNGTVTGVSRGITYITVAAVDNPAKTATVAVTVGTLVKAITLSQYSAGVETGKSIQLYATITPADVTNPGLIWSSSNTEVATVTSAGLVSTWKSGVTTITVTAADGSGVSSACLLTVSGADVTTPAPGYITPAPGLNPPEGQLAYVNTQQGSLNLRSNASQSSSRLTTIPENAAFTLITYGKTWCYVWYNGYYGYVMTKYVRLAVPTAITENTPTPTPAPDAPSGTTAFVYTEKGSLNLRREASQTAEILTRIPENGTFTVITYGKKWSYAWYNGYYGYVMSAYLRLAGETAMPVDSSKPITPVTPVPATPTPAPTLSANQAMVTTPSGKLNLRKTASQNGARVALIQPGEIVEVITYGKTWCYVRYNGLVGYVMTKFLVLGTDPVSPATPVPVTGGQYAQVTTASGGLNLRKGPSQGYARELVIPQNAYVQVITAGPTWCYVQYNNYVGYVMTKFLTMI